MHVFHDETIHGKRKRLVGIKLTKLERTKKHTQLFSRGLLLVVVFRK